MSRSRFIYVPTTPPGVNLAGTAGAALIEREACDGIERVFRAHGNVVIPCSFIIARRDPKTRLSFKGGPRLLQVLSDPRFMSSNEKKDELSKILHETCARVGALGATFGMEMWMSHDPNAYDKYTSLAKDPSRFEALFVLIEHVAAPTYSVVNRIERGSGGEPMLTGWKRSQFDAHDTASRFANFLPGDQVYPPRPASP